MVSLQDRIFISFASADRKIARAMCDDLEKNGFACWISSRDVRGGENYQEAIVQALRAVKVMVLVFSQNANASNEIKKELALASQTNTVVIPFRIENAAPNAALAYELATRQWIDAFDDRDEALRLLGERIGGIVTASGDTQPAPQPRSAEPRWHTPSPQPREMHKKPLWLRLFKWYVAETRKSVARTKKLILPMFGVLIGAVVIMAIAQALDPDVAAFLNGSQAPLLNGQQQLINGYASPELMQAVATRDELARLVDEKAANLTLQQSYYDQAAKSGKYDRGTLMKFESGVENATRELNDAQARLKDAQYQVLRLQAANLKQ